MQDFYLEQKSIKAKHNEISTETKLTSADKKDIKKYTDRKEDIDYILSYGQQNIAEFTKNISKIDTILDKSKNYDEQYNKLIKNNTYKDELKKWKINYQAIYKQINTINKNISELEETLNKIKNEFEKISKELGVIYLSIKNSAKLNPILKIKEIIDDNLKILENIKSSITKLKIAFLNETPTENIEYNTIYAEAGIKVLENSIKDIKDKLINDKNFIEDKNKDIFEVKKVGGGTHLTIENPIENSLQLYNISGGAPDDIYDNFLKLDMKSFLEYDCNKMIKLLKTINTDLKSEDLALFKYKTNDDFKNIMKTYFHIYLFFMYYSKTRSDELNGESIDLNIDTDLIILFFIQIYNIYKIIEFKQNQLVKEKDKDKHKNKKTYVDIPEIIKKKIKDKITNIETELENFINTQRNKEKIS